MSGPGYMQIRLKEYRELAKATPDISASMFVEGTKEVDENAIVVLEPYRISLLVDEDGELLQFS